MVRRNQNAEQTSQVENEVPEALPEFRRQQVLAQAKSALPELTHRVISTSELHAISSMDEARALFEQVSGQTVVEARDEIGDGFDYLDNKDLLIGKPAFFLQWDCTVSGSFTDRDGNPLRTVQAWVCVEVAGEIRKVRISDFSTGICKDLWEYTIRTGRSGGLYARKGLRKSEFPYVDPDTGQRTVATTYYIDLSKDL